MLTLNPQADGMEMIALHLKLPPDMLRVVDDLARRRDVTAGQIVRQMIADGIRYETQRAKTPVRADEQLLAPLRARLARDLAHAGSWRDLQTRLRAQGVEFRPAGGGLTLHRFPGGDRLCKASELGYSYARLVQRFRAGFPGHAHSWVADRILTQKGGPEGPPHEDPVLIEDD
jgi:hypothetical protein